MPAHRGTAARNCEVAAALARVLRRRRSPPSRRMRRRRSRTATSVRAPTTCAGTSRGCSPRPSRSFRPRRRKPATGSANASPLSSCARADRRGCARPRGAVSVSTSRARARSRWTAATRTRRCASTRRRARTPCGATVDWHVTAAEVAFEHAVAAHAAARWPRSWRRCATVTARTLARAPGGRIAAVFPFVDGVTGRRDPATARAAARVLARFHRAVHDVRPRRRCAPHCVSSSSLVGAARTVRALRRRSAGRPRARLGRAGRRDDGGGGARRGARGRVAPRRRARRPEPGQRRDRRGRRGTRA